MSFLHGGDIVSQRLRYPDSEVLDFSTSINPLGTPEGVRRALADCDCSVYPDPFCRELTAALAAYEGVPEEWVLCGGGSSELIYRIIGALRPRQALLPAPTFLEYERALALFDCETVHFPLLAERGFELRVDFLSQIDHADIVFLCNPNNPTGALLPEKMLETALWHCRKNGAVLVVDESLLGFCKYSAEKSMKKFLEDAGGLIILSSFTELFALPGLRLGQLLCANREMLERIRMAGPPWSVSAPAQACGIQATREKKYLSETRRKIPLWKQQLRSGIMGQGCEVFPADANFLLFRARQGLCEALAPQGILLRNCENFHGLGPGWYRLGVRSEQDNSRLLAALKQVL